MKKYSVKSIIIFAAMIFFSGCYTELWMPEDEFPSESSYNEFYSEPYFGDYYSFYDYPWWLRLTPPSIPVGDEQIRNENGTTSSLRNEGQGRGTPDDRKIISTSPPSREGSNSSSTNSNSTSSSSSNNNSSGNSNSNSSSTRSSDNSSIRNNDGNRNTNSGRK